ncbi:TrmH family RNA methyltransferase [Planosporangium sp. 12N6]|uniref:TrmH family RNA methyltransferase n=1 Tax=Planosporangium spinosum TaxID=3402278 RepID=UPI003CED71B6
MSTTVKVTARNARFQQWQALLTNRTKRQRAGEFLVQGVRPISLAVAYGWDIRALLYPAGRPLSRWARDLIDRATATTAATTLVAMAPELLYELGGKEDERPELVAVVALPPDRLDRIPARDDLLVVVFDRPTTPGNIGTLIRSADAFGASGVVVSGHAADPYDPKAVRASTGSLFAVPVVRTAAHHEVVAWVAALRGRGLAVQVVGTDEHGDVEVGDHDLRGPTLVAVGNETHGLSTAWRQACDRMVRIPMTGAASSLNAASAGTVVLYEAARQRSRARVVDLARGRPPAGEAAATSS